MSTTEKRNAGEPPTVEQAVPDYIASVEKYKSVAERVAEEYYASEYENV